MQDELDELMTTWNSYKITAKAGQGVIGGRPILEYTLPQMYGGEDNLKTIDMEELALCKEECTPKNQYLCDETVFDLCCLLMQEKGWDAILYFIWLLNHFLCSRKEVHTIVGESCRIFDDYRFSPLNFVCCRQDRVAFNSVFEY